MKVLKFGGSSVANAENIQKVVNIVIDNDEPQVVVVSALGGVTDALIKTGMLAEQSDETYKEILQQLEKKHLDTARALLPVTHQSSCLSMIKQQFNEIGRNLQQCFLFERIIASNTEIALSVLGNCYHQKLLTHFCNQKI